MDGIQEQPFLLFFRLKLGAAFAARPIIFLGDTMRIGIFGGSFDPIHTGHLILAEHCREQAHLDQVWFIPSAQSPHKTGGAVGSDRQRTEMIDLAIGGHSSFLRLSIEIERGGVSYTVDTLEQLRQQHPDDELFLLVGGDSLNHFHSWKQPHRIVELATPLVVARPGEGAVNFDLLAPFADQQRLAQMKALAIEAPLVDISSTAIRRAVENEMSYRYLTPRSVERYIQTQKIYRASK